MALISQEEDEFATWAFGDKWSQWKVGNANSMDLMNAWNAVHGSLLLLHEDGDILEDMKRMKKLYEAR